MAARSIGFVILLALVGSVIPALAQENLVLKQEVQRDDKKKLGWTPSAKVGVNASLSSSNNFVGKPEGSSETYGLDLKAGYDFAGPQNEWRNTLTFTGTTNKTPVQPRYVKGNDLLKFESLYLHNFADHPKLGPYVSASASAPLFFGEDVRQAPTAYSIRYRNGTTQAFTSDTLRLTDPLRPLTTRESAGLFWKAFNDGNVRIEVRVGLGAEQNAAEGQLAITGTNAGIVSVEELRNLSQLGVETGLTGKGKINEQTGWELGVETLTPFVSNKEASDDRDALRLTNVDGFAKLSSNLTAWAALSYDYRLLLKPALLDKTQQSHMLVLNINYNLF